MAFDKRSIARLYKKRAGHYDLSANTYYLIGVRELAYRKMAVQALNLEQSDTVAEIGCGTGLNFSILRQRVGPAGRIIGVDLTPEMLEKADRRVRLNGWSNVELIQSDADAYQFPDTVSGILSTFAMTLIPEYDKIIQKGAAALPPGKRFVILDFKKPENWPMWLVKLFVIVTRPFGVTLDLAERHPWESIDRYMATVEFRELYFGAIYLSVGKTY
jgi:ubiquinone/menaquinone biosynthesis C-methylase UbiE